MLRTNKFLCLERHIALALGALDAGGAANVTFVPSDIECMYLVELHDKAVYDQSTVPRCDQIRDWEEVKKTGEGSDESAAILLKAEGLIPYTYRTLLAQLSLLSPDQLDMTLTVHDTETDECFPAMFAVTKDYNEEQLECNDILGPAHPLIRTKIHWKDAR